MLRIVPYLPQHQPHFERMNRAWIERYFCMEPIDEMVLTRPDEHILAPGGQILMALWNDEIAGTVALKRVENGWIEMTKMAVDPEFQGKKIGEALVRACMDEAQKMGTRRLLLYSNTVLQSAIHLYRKVGFTETLIRGATYQRSDIKMEMPFYAFTAEERQELLTDYARVPADVAEAFTHFPKEMWHWRESPERWNIHEIIQHLCDSEVNSYLRCRRMIAEPGSLITAYDENRWSKELAYESQGAEAALILYTQLRQSTYNLIKNLPETTWQRHAIHTENGRMTLDDWLWIYTHHSHIGQLRRLFTKWSKAVGNGQ